MPLDAPRWEARLEEVRPGESWLEQARLEEVRPGEARLEQAPLEEVRLREARLVDILIELGCANRDVVVSGRRQGTGVDGTR